MLKPWSPGGQRAYSMRNMSGSRSDGKWTARSHFLFWRFERIGFSLGLSDFGGWSVLPLLERLAENLSGCPGLPSHIPPLAGKKPACPLRQCSKGVCHLRGSSVGLRPSSVSEHHLQGFEHQRLCCLQGFILSSPYSATLKTQI